MGPNLYLSDRKKKLLKILNKIDKSSFILLHLYVEFVHKLMVSVNGLQIFGDWLLQTFC